MSSAKSVKFKFCFYIVTVQTSYEQAQRLLLHYFSRPEESQIPSITEFSVNYKINPATALKGINLLVDQEIVYKKRGVGMFVAEGAVRKLRQKRKDTFYQDYIEAMIAEARRLELSAAEIKEMIEKGFEDIV